MVTDYLAPVDRIKFCFAFFFFSQGVFSLAEVIVLRLHIHQICFTGSFFFPQTSPSANWFLHCDPEIGQRLKAINYASWCVPVEHRRHNAALLSAIIPGCFLLFGEHSLFFSFSRTFPCCPLSSDTLRSMSTRYFFLPLQNKITSVLCSRFIVHCGREGTFFFFFTDFASPSTFNAHNDLATHSGTHTHTDTLLHW